MRGNIVGNTSYFIDQILDPLCGALETDLRLQVHSHLQLDDSNPFRNGVKTLQSFLQLPNIPFFDKEIDIKGKRGFSVLEIVMCEILSNQSTDFYYMFFNPHPVRI